MNYEFQHNLMHVFGMKEDIIKDIMKQVLGREPNLSDAKDFRFIKHERYPKKEFIAHTQMGLLGEIVFDTIDKGNAYSFTFKFIPKNKFDD